MLLRAPAHGEFVGIVLARRSVDVQARLEGVIGEVAVETGQHVSMGEVVLTMQARGVERQLKETLGALRAAETDRLRARIERGDAERRLAQLEKMRDLVSPADLESARAQLRIAETKVGGFEAQVRTLSAKAQFDRTYARESIVKAPFEGAVAARYVTAGALVTPGVPLLRIIDPHDLYVRFAVPGDHTARIAQGEPVELVLANGDSVFTGTVTTVSPEVDAVSGSIVAEATIGGASSNGGRLLPGMEVRVRLLQRAETSVNTGRTLR